MIEAAGVACRPTSRSESPHLVDKLIFLIILRLREGRALPTGR
jgi:hypothetical protein